jgi:hypothetical protein
MGRGIGETQAKSEDFRIRAIAYRSFSQNNSPDKQDGTGESCKSVASRIVFGLSKRAIIQLR